MQVSGLEGFENKSTQVGPHHHSIATLRYSHLHPVSGKLWTLGKNIVGRWEEGNGEKRWEERAVPRFVDHHGGHRFWTLPLKASLESSGKSSESIYFSRT